ncbi:MAG: lipoprotein-releasing system ATP-binding protein LolD, partial [Halomonas sp.]
MQSTSTPSNATPAAAGGANEPPVMLDCQELTRVYSEGPQDLTVLDKLELSVRAGERVAIVGSSGSG